jgi:hypothetical protein
MDTRPPKLNELIHNEEWLKIFCTYKQERAILHWAHEHRGQCPIRIEIFEGEEQSFITLHFEDGVKMTF